MDALHCICGAELEDPRFRTCEACRSKQRDRMRCLIAGRRREGKCVRCDAKAEAGAHCKWCWFAMMARNALGSRTRGPDLARLWLAPRFPSLILSVRFRRAHGGEFSVNGVKEWWP